MKNSLVLIWAILLFSACEFKDIQIAQIPELEQPIEASVKISEPVAEETEENVEATEVIENDDKDTIEVLLNKDDLPENIKNVEYAAEMIAGNQKVFETKVEYPQLKIPEGEINPINQKINETIAEHALEAANEFELQAKNDFELGYMMGHYSYDQNYSISYAGDYYLSILFYDYQYTGGAHPNGFYMSKTFDLINGETVNIDHFLLPGGMEEVQKIVRRELRVKLGDAADESWLQDGTAINQENYSTFALEEDALIVYINSYQVAPYAAGPTIVRIPVEDLEGYILKDF
ncbi:DUF4163 domain-containing protein [Candidatus Peregrinibacteria bacterium]|nr:DUF4163 domain-containing protein [Candidatus Peregrinibacteria bacterium]